MTYSERERVDKEDYGGKDLWKSFLANVNSRSRSHYVVVRSSVVFRLSVYNVRAPYSGH